MINEQMIAPDRDGGSDSSMYYVATEASEKVCIRVGMNPYQRSVRLLAWQSSKTRLPSAQRPDSTLTLILDRTISR